tara:strand:+ start:50285 stop:50509 length:225 start_codon:yes stop_codon:yes gene_type:complete
MSKLTSNLITLEDALKIATQFLDERAERTTHKTQIGAVLCGMYIVSKEGEEVETSDPIIWEDWLAAAEKVLDKK